MVSGMLEAATLQSASGLQRWRQLVDLLTADIADSEQLLRRVADELRAVTNACACRITYNEPDTAVVDITSGIMPQAAQNCVAEAVEGASAPFLRLSIPLADGLVWLLPLKCGVDVVGWLQVMDGASALSGEGLDLIAVMVGNALARQAAQRQLQQSHREEIARALATNNKLTAVLRLEQERLIRREVEVRTQIGRDLHDGPVQQVAVAALSVQYVRRVAERAPDRFNEALDDLHDQLKRVSRDLRVVLYELRPLGMAEQGLVSVLQQYVARVNNSNGLQIQLNVPADLPRLSVDAEGAIFIIMQEALNNARKHAEATHVWFRLRADASALIAEVQDNGRGFDVERTQANYIQQGSYGLGNMRERAELLGGTCAIASAPGAGTIVQVRVPLHH